MALVTLIIILCALVFQTCTQFTSAEIASCRKPSKTGCGSVIDFTSTDLPGIIVYGYKFSDLEKNGICSRADVQYENQPTKYLENNIVDECICENTACSTCIENKKKVDNDSCCGLIKYPYFGNTYYFVDENKTNPKCCAAEGMDSNNDPITECYCDACAEGCSTLCPAPVTGRVIGGRPIESCGTGVVRIGIGNGDQVLCNAIYAFNPKGKDSNGNQLEFTPMVFAPKVCLDGIKMLQDMDTTVDVTIGNTSFALEKDQYTRIPLNNIFSDGMTFDKYTGPCFDQPVCTYDKDTMAGCIDKQQCYLLSYGADGLVDGILPEYSGNLSTLPVFQVGSMGKCSGPPKKMSAECFFPANVAAFHCTGDIGAPVFCMLKTGEKVLYGTFAQTVECGPDQKLFPVIPIS